MKQEWVLLGAGGHARVVLDAIGQLGWRDRVRGVLAPQVSDWQRERLGVPWLGGDEFLAACDPEGTILVNGVGSVGRIGRRASLFEEGRDLGFAFGAVIHPWAMVSAGATLGQGVQIMARGVVQTGACLAENVLINTGAIVDHDCRLEAHVHIASGAILSGGVLVGRGTHVGSGAVVRQGIVLGSGVVVGAGAVVVRDVRDGAVVMGCPAREKER